MFKQLLSDDGEVNLLLISTLLLGLSTVLFGVLAIAAFTSDQRSKSTLNEARTVAYKQGQAAQQIIDNKASATANQLPYRNYKAPDLYGNFEIKFPKNWNAYVIEDQAAGTQVNLTLNPNAVKVDKSLKVTNYAFRALLIDKPQPQIYADQFQPLVKSGKLQQKSTTVSGIGATWLEGKFDSQHNGIIVLVPVRDKTLELITDNRDYLEEFKQILAQSTIVR